MNQRPEAEPVDAQVVGADGEPEEIVDGEPVLDDGPGSLVYGPGSLVSTGASNAVALAAAASPAVQAAAVAATGFVAGAATLAIVRRRDARRSARGALRRHGADALPIVGTRTFLIDVHMLRPDR